MIALSDAERVAAITAIGAFLGVMVAAAGSILVAILQGRKTRQLNTLEHGGTTERLVEVLTEVRETRSLLVDHITRDHGRGGYQYVEEQHQEAGHPPADGRQGQPEAEPEQDGEREAQRLQEGLLTTPDRTVGGPSSTAGPGDGIVASRRRWLQYVRSSSGHAAIG